MGYIARRAMLLTVLGIYYVPATILHLPFTEIIITPRETPLGTFAPTEYMGAAGKAALLGLVLYILRHCVAGRCARRIIAAWVVWFGAIWLSDRYLLFHPNEYVHFPQYALFAMLLHAALAAAGRPPAALRVLFWSVLAGGLDELMQYLFLCPDYGHYVDFNDIFFNAQGAAAGLLLLATRAPAVSETGGRSAAARGWVLLRAEPIAAVCLAAGLAAGFLSGALQKTPPHAIPPGGTARIDNRQVLFLERMPGMFGSWTARPDGGAYYVLGPWPAGWLIACYCIAFGSALAGVPARSRESEDG